MREKLRRTMPRRHARGLQIDRERYDAADLLEPKRSTVPSASSSAGFTRALIWSPRSVEAGFVTRLEALPPRYTSVVAALSEDASDRWLRPRLEADFGQALLNQHVASLPVSGGTALALPRGTHDSAAGGCHAGQ